MDGFSLRMMRRAVSLARRGLGKTSPNPMVGCVVVRDGRIVGEGWHRKAGTPHAEVHALNQSGDKARGADVYVTLEPCCHHGKTPPCTDALIKAGVARVFIGMKDPNPLVAGGGISALRKAGIDIECGILERECMILNENFIKHITTGLPFIILKSAMTLDGKTATSAGDSKWITCEKSRRYVHRLRATVDAVAVGVGTVVADDPQLTCRMGIRGKDPLRIVVDSRLRTPLEAVILGLESKSRTVIATTESDPCRAEAYVRRGADVLVCAESEGRVDIHDLFRKLGDRGVQSVLIEGGRDLAGSLVRKGLVDKYFLFYAPKIYGGEDGLGFVAGTGPEKMEAAYRLRDITLLRFDQDILVQAYPERSCLPV